MPNQQILNFMNQGAAPLISEQVDARNLAQAQGYADVNSSMAGTEMQRMKNDTFRERSNVLRNFEGNTRSPGFASQMGAVDPVMLADMQNQAAKMDKAERERMQEQFSEFGRVVMMADNPTAWQQSHITVPFERREEIMAKIMSVEQILGYKGGKYEKSPPGGAGEAAKPLKATDERFITTKIANRYEGSKFDPVTKEYVSSSNAQFRNEISEISSLAVEIYNRNRNMKGGMSAASDQAYKQFHKKKKSNTFQSGAGPSSGKDYTHLM